MPMVAGDEPCRWEADLLNSCRIGVVALAGVLLAVSGCDPMQSSSPEVAGLRDALTSQPEALEMSSSFERAMTYEQLRRRTEVEARAQMLDGPAMLAVESQGHLVPTVLPSARELLAGTAVQVDVERSSDPWPGEPRAGLEGRSERDLAQLAGSTLVASLGISRPIEIERAAGAPYAAAFVQDRLRLNPSLLYLASASQALEAGAADASTASDGRLASCSAAGSGVFLPFAALAATLPLLRRRRPC